MKSLFFLSLLIASSAHASIEQRLNKLEKIVALQHALIKTQQGTFDYTASDGTRWIGEWYKNGRIVTIACSIVDAASDSNYQVNLSDLGIHVEPARNSASRTGKINRGSIGYPFSGAEVDIGDNGVPKLVVQRRLDNGSAAAVDLTEQSDIGAVTISYLAK